jgi:hypothetical protein
MLDDGSVIRPEDTIRFHQHEVRGMLGARTGGVPARLTLSMDLSFLGEVSTNYLKC